MTKEKRHEIAEALIGARANINACLRMLAEQDQIEQPERKKTPLTFSDESKQAQEDDGA